MDKEKSSTSTGSLSPEDAYRKKLEDIVTEGGYIDPHMLSRSAIRKKAHRGPVHRSREEKAFQKMGGLRISDLIDDDEARETHARTDTVGFIEGMFEIYKMWARSTVMAPRITDHVLFFHQLVQYHLGTSAEKISYCKDFMSKYANEAEWAPLFRSDMPLLSEHVHTRPYHRDSGGRDRSISVKTRSQIKRDREETGRGYTSGGPKKKVHTGKSSRRSRYCYSRINKTVGQCNKGGKCDFSHDCASCGKNHAAVDCPSWDAAKVKDTLRG